MTTIQSLLKPYSLRQLIPAIRRLRSTHPLPFYLLKVRSNSLPTTFQGTAIALNRAISNDFLRAQSPIFTIWSPHHLDRLAHSQTTRFDTQVILKNPYKSEQLIGQALKAGVRSMVIDCVQEYNKIESFKNSQLNIKSKNVKYLWACSGEDQPIEQLAAIKNRVSGLTFEWEDNSSRTRIDAITRSILELGGRIEKVICGGKTQQIEQLRQWEKEPLHHKGKVISKMIEINNYSDVQNYVLVTRTLNNNAPVIDSQAQELIQGVRYDKDCLMVTCERQNWLISKISKMPLSEQPYLYHLEKDTQAQEPQMSNIISVM